MGLLSTLIKNTSLSIKDEDDFNAAYCAIRSSDVKLLKSLISKWSCKNSTTHLQKLDKVLSRAYDELRLKNVLMKKEMEFFIQSKLVDLRFYSQKEEVPLTLDNIEERIDLLLEKIRILCAEYSSAAVDEKFLYISKFITHNIHVLKQQLKATYKKLPWEEIEFCLVHFISSHTKQKEINLFSQSILTKDNILNKLDNFSKPLEYLKSIIKMSDVGVLGQSLNLKREQIIKDIIERYPSLQDLYDDYKGIRDVYSLDIIKNHIDAALVAECGTTEGQLTIDRALQVSGEHLKNTSGSPKLSETSIARLRLLAPKETAEILIDLRNSLSHTNFLEDTEGNELLKHLLYSSIQNDLRKIGTAITEILFCCKVEKINFLLTYIINSDNLDEMYEIFNTLQLNISDVDKMFHAGQTTNEDQQIEGLVEEISGRVPEKTEYEKEIFNKINDIIEHLKVMYRDKLKDYSTGCTMLNGMCFSSFNEKSLANRTNNSITKAMILKASEIHNFFSAPSDPQKIKKIQELKKLLFVFYESVEPRIPPENALELRNLLRIFFNAVFEKDNITETDKFRELIKNKYKSNLVEEKCKQKKTTSKLRLNNLLNMKLAQLKKILSNSMNKSWPLTESDSNKFMIEMSVLEVMNILNDLKCLVNNVPFLDDNSPVLTGKSLRNHLAHGNPIIDILFPDCFFAVFSNAMNLTKIKNIENHKIGKIVTSNIEDLKQKYDRDLNIIEQKKEMCNALINGNLKKLKKCLKEGADTNSRSINLRTMLHHAAWGPSLECVKFLLLDQNISANLKDLNGQTPLHIASAQGRTNIVQFLVTEVHLQIDEIDNTGKTPLIIACQHGCVKTVEALLTLRANKNIKDFAGWSPLHHAVENNNKNVVKILLAEDVHVDVNAIGGSFTSLHLAAENGNLQLVQYLLRRKADYNASNSIGERPLHLASLNGHLEVVNVLIEKGADLECETFDTGCTPLCYAVRSENENIVRTLLENDANVKVCDKYNQTTLHVACNNGNRDIAELLIENKADLNAINHDGETPILCAARKGHEEIVDLLINKNSSVDCRDNNGSTALHLSAMNGHGNIIRYLIKNESIDINAKNKFDQTPLHLAAENGHWEIVDILLMENADIDAVDANGLTALHLIIVSEALESKNILNDYTSSREAAERPSRKTIVDIFLSHKANVNIESKCKNTPLHLASLYGHSEAVKALIKGKKSINSKTEYSTALHLAVASNHKEVVQILIENGADVSMVNEENCTALSIAVENNYEDVVNILIEKGVDVNAESKRPLTVAMLEGYRSIAESLLKHKDIDIHFEDRVTGTPLHLAASNDDRHLGELLIKKGAKLEAVHDDHTPLSRAVYQGHKEFVDLLLENGANVNCKVLHIAIELGYTDIVECLLHCETKNSIGNRILTYDYINVNDKGDDTFSLLHVAAKEGNLCIVKYLIDRGADIDAETILGTKPIHTAAFFGHVNIVDFFLENGSSVGNTDEDGGSLLYYAAEGGQPDVAQYLIEKNVNVNFLDEDGMQPIHAAAQFGHLDVVKVLLDSGSIYNTKDNSGRKPLDWTSNDDISKLLNSIDSLFTAVRVGDIVSIENMINNGTPVNVKRTNGSTLLHFAVWKDSPRACDTLLKNNANPNAVRKSGGTPLHYAAKFSCLKIVKSLLANGAIYNITTDNCKTPLNHATTKSVEDILKLVDKSFTKVKNCDVSVIEDLIKIEDVDTVKAVMKACNKDLDTLIIVAINNDFPQVEMLEQILNACV